MSIGTAPAGSRTPDRSAPGSTATARTCWALAAAVVVAQISYPLVDGRARTAVTLATVVVFFAASVVHAAVHGGPRVAAALLGTAGLGGLLVEAIGTRTGLPFGPYDYTDTLGLQVAGVPWVIPLAWTMMAWPAWCAASVLARSPVTRVLLAGWALATWDVFLDAQMVAAGHWVWADPDPGLPGVPGIPLTNYAGWVLSGVAMMALLAVLARPGRADGSRPSTVGAGPALALYLWTYVSSVLAHLAFFDLPGSAAWGALAMGTVAVPLAVRLYARRRARR